MFHVQFVSCPPPAPRTLRRLYHVTSRGDRREDIYLNDEDRIAWLDILGRFAGASRDCHAWCQMTNHYHLVLETPEGTSPRACGS